ncbi:MAG: heme NO-binding domain-containing protein [Pseudomonadota bacterium]
MIGIIEKVIVDCLLDIGGDELRLDVFLDAGIPPERVYRIDQHYPDAETARLIASALRCTGLAEPELFRRLSVSFFDVVEHVFPEFLRMCRTSEELVRRQAKIHALIAAGSRRPGESEKSTDKFAMESLGPHHVRVRYRSELQLDGFFETLVREAAARFGDEVEIPPYARGGGGADGSMITVKWTSIAGRPTRFADRRANPAERRAMHG